MPPLWQQRRDLRDQILITLSAYMQDQSKERCQTLALNIAGMAANLLPLKKLTLWLDLLEELSEKQHKPRCETVCSDYPIEEPTL